MNDDLIKSVSLILLEWNPLEERAGLMEDLEGYRYEAIDIISAVKTSNMTTKKAVSNVLTQAFNITLDETQLLKYSAAIDRNLNGNAQAV